METRIAFKKIKIANLVYIWRVNKIQQSQQMMIHNRAVESLIVYASNMARIQL